MSPPEVRRRPVPKDQPSANDQAATTLPDRSSLPNLPGYAVLLVTRYGMPRRKIYLDLGHARAAVQRAEANGQPAELVLVRLTPVTADLDGGELS